MALKDHLREFRNRLIAAAIAVLVGAVGGWFIYDPVFAAIQEPIRHVAAQEGRRAVINFAGVASSFDLKLQGSIFLGVLITSPFWIYQVWAFITPGLKTRERRYTLGYMMVAIPLFFGGVWIAWMVLPSVVAVLTSFTPPDASNIILATDYIAFVMRMLIAIGLAFLVPVVLVAVNAAGILSGKTILKGWRITVFLVFVLAAMAAPGADAMSMFLLAAPLLVLFFAAIGICLLHDRRKAKRLAAAADETDATADTATPTDELEP